MEIKLQNTLGGLTAGATSKKTNQETPVGVEDSEASSTSIGRGSSAASFRLSEIKERLLSESPVDQSRVARIAGAVQSGGYKIDAQQAADRLIVMERMLPSSS